MAHGNQTRRTARSVRAPGASGYVGGGLVLVGGAWLALSRGASPTSVSVAAVLGLVAGAAVLLLPRPWNLPACVVVLVTGAGLLARVDRASIPAWIGGVVLGLFLGLQLLWNRQQHATTAGDAARAAPRDDGEPPG